MSRIGSGEEGHATKARLFGDVPSASGTSFDGDIAPVVKEISERVLWGTIWSRGTVDLKTRCLCTISALMGLQRYEYARIHIRGARRLGVSEEEMSEVMLQLAFYAGMPVTHTGLEMVKDVYRTAEDDITPS